MSEPLRYGLPMAKPYATETSLHQRSLRSLLPNTPRASLTILEQDVTATVAIAALNPTEWNDNDSITIRRRIGVRTTALWPTDGQAVRYRDFTPPTFPSITPTYNAQLSRLTAGTNYTIELWVNGIAVAPATFTTKAAQSAVLTRVFRVGADWENIIASAVTLSLIHI